MKSLLVPAGIGDFSWIWSKLYSVRNDILQFLVVDGWPHRTVPYIELCGAKASYEVADYQTILLNSALHGCTTWKQYMSYDAEGMSISANLHLEMGKPLRDFLPDLPTTYHYPLYYEHCNEEVDSLLQTTLRRGGNPRVGISCASYRGSEAWKTWGRTEWCDIVRRVLRDGWQPVLLGGFWDDLTRSVAHTLDIPDLVGKTNVGEGVALLNKLDAYIGFSSGLGVVRTVLRKGALMLWPEFQLKLSTSWAPPEYFESGKYVALPWCSTDDAWVSIKQYLDYERNNM